MASPDVVICSFFTDDDYYRDHANNLRKNLESLGLAYELREIHKAEGDEWPDICRKKMVSSPKFASSIPIRKSSGSTLTAICFPSRTTSSIPLLTSLALLEASAEP